VRSSHLESHWKDRCEECIGDYSIIQESHSRKGNTIVADPEEEYQE